MPTVNGRDLTLPTRTQTSEQEYSGLTASDKLWSIPYYHNTPQSFSRGTGLMLSRGRQNVCLKVFDKIPRFLNNLLESGILVCTTMARMKTALDIIQLWFIHFAASFFKVLGNVNVKHLKIPEKHCGPHETPSRATCGPRVACLRPLF